MLPHSNLLLTVIYAGDTTMTLPTAEAKEAYASTVAGIITSLVNAAVVREPAIVVKKGRELTRSPRPMILLHPRLLILLITKLRSKLVAPKPSKLEPIPNLKEP